MGYAINSLGDNLNSPFIDKKSKKMGLLWEVADKVRTLNNPLMRYDCIHKIQRLRMNWNEDIDLISELNLIKKKLQYYYSKYKVVPPEFKDDFEISTSSQSEPLVLNDEEWAYFTNVLEEDKFNEELKRLYSKKPENLTNLF